MASRLTKSLASLAAVASLAFASPLSTAFSVEELRAHDHKSHDHSSEEMQGEFSQRLSKFETAIGGAECVDGTATIAEVEFPCDGIDLLAFVPTKALGQEMYGDGSPEKIEGSDIWGWSSPKTKHEYVIMGKTNGTAFFRLAGGKNNKRLVNLGELPNRASEFSVWKDIKVSDDHAFIVAEASDHGMQVFDLRQLDGLKEDPTRRFEELTHYTQESNTSHNIVINDDTDMAYIVGASTGDRLQDVTCGNGGLHFVDISNPAFPEFEGCSLIDLYVHDSQCVIYDGPDTRYTGRELCFNAAEEWVSIVDVTDKSNPTRIGLFPYPRSSYVHQGWLTEDHRFFLLGDETDERTFGFNTRTMIFDFTSLTTPQLPVEHFGPTTAIDHNMYVKDGLVYQANYAAGLRILDTEGLYDGTPSLDEIAFFDVFPDHDEASFVGTWSSYPYFRDGVVAVNAYDGLFLLQVDEDLLEDEEFDPRDED